MEYETQYLQIMRNILLYGEDVEDRTGTGCKSTFGQMMEIDLSEGFPLLTTKKMFYKNIIGEALWFLSGKVDLPSLRHYQNKEKTSHTIWSDDFDQYKASSGRKIIGEDLGAIYGRQLRQYSTVDERGVPVGHDQLITLLDNINAVKVDPSHPMARRLICSFWNPYDHTLGDKEWCALPACHTDFQCMVRDGRLDLRFSMRSNDWFLGAPYNVASYAFFCHILAQICGLKVGRLLYFGTDVHLYNNHIDVALEQLRRCPHKLPRLVLPPFSDIEGLLRYTAEDFTIKEYTSHGFIRAQQAS